MRFRTCFTVALLSSLPIPIGCSSKHDPAESLPDASGGANSTSGTSATGGSNPSMSKGGQSSSSGGSLATTAASSASANLGGSNGAVGGTLNASSGGTSSATVPSSASGGAVSLGGSSSGNTSSNSKANGGSSSVGQPVGGNSSASNSSGGNVNGSSAGGVSAKGGSSGGNIIVSGGSSASASGGSNGSSQNGGNAGASTTAGGTATGGSSGSSSSVVSSDCNDKSDFTKALIARYDGAFIPVTDSTKTYRATTNWWFMFSGQTVDVNQIGFKVGNPNAVDVGTSGNPAGYPAIYIGAYSGNNSTGSNLPKQVSALTSVPTIFSTNALSMDNSNFNAAYDVWFTATNAPLTKGKSSPGVGGAYLMVWLFDPEDRQPRGKNAHPAHTVDGVAGAWDVWIDGAPTDPLCISYVSTTPLDSLSFDLNKFIRDAVTNSYGITDSMYLSVVFAGFEIWGGGDGLELKQFCADVK